MVTKRQNWFLKFGVLAIVNPSLIMLSLAYGGPVNESKVTPVKPTVKKSAKVVKPVGKKGSKTVAAKASPKMATIESAASRLAKRLNGTHQVRATTGQETKVLGRVTPEQRKAAAASRRAARANAAGPFAGPDIVPGMTPDYFGSPNYANSPLPQFDAQGNHIAGTGIRKFVDGLPGLGPDHANNLGNYIPVAQKVTNAAFPNDDYYEVAVNDFLHQWTSDLPSSKVRGYRDLSPSAQGGNFSHYFGPFIFAEADRPVRLKFVNQIGIGDAGNLFLPVDKTLMGAGEGPHQTGVDGNGNPVFEQYTENRALIHLHGGKTPWISDGTPHQWIVPAGETTSYKKGVSARNVPDMADPGDGAMTYYFTNQQSSRQMFYHDHTSGMTRLNFYAGEASGYFITDKYEKDLIDGTNLSGINPELKQVLPSEAGDHRYGIPLVIQDKTFVPDTAQLKATDPTWDTTKWGGMGSLWYPHVYTPNQNPFDISGANGMGRYDYGEWFWPVWNLEKGSVPNPYANYPGQPPIIPGVPHPSAVPEAFLDVMTVNGTAFPTMQVDRKSYRFRFLNACTERYVNLQLYYVDPAHPTEIRMLPASPHKVTDSIATTGKAPLVNIGMTGLGVGFTNPTLNPDGTVGTGLPDGGWPDTWPRDNRVGGVPDPADAGPAWIQVGSEAGFLPAPVVIPSAPFGYEYMRRTIVVLNNSTHSLWIGPAERADVVVDFSSVPAGSKIIMYNDAAAPLPGFDARFDYFTGNDDMTDSGGAPSTVEGFAPNTRTIMRFEVSNAPAAAPVNLTDLTTLVQAAHKASHPAPIVPQSAYNAVRGQNYADTYSSIQANTLTFTPLNEVTGAPTGPAATVPMEPKAIHELFETKYGRMNAVLGVERPLSTANIQTTLPMGYFDPVTENMSDNNVQIWKVTHNGVDSHVMHFHLFDIQLINRVGWDGAVTWPEANELGWKESVKMHPLMDTIVAMRPKHMSLPFVVPDNIRPLDPTKPVDAPITINDPASFRQTVTVANANTNFMWDYAWHCHLLGHEENDMMRPVSVSVSKAKPVIPGGCRAVTTSGRNVISWTTNAVNWNYRVDRQASGSNNWVLVGSTVGNTTSLTDLAVNLSGTYTYRVSAINGGGQSTYATASVTIQANSPISNVTCTASTLSAAAPAITLNWTNALPSATSIQILRSTDPSFVNNVTTINIAGNATNYIDTTVGMGQTFYYVLRSVNATGPFQYTAAVSATTPGRLPAAATGLTATASAPSANAPTITLGWTVPAQVVPLQGILIERSTVAGFTAGTVTQFNVASTARTFIDTTVQPATTYYYRVVLQNQYGNSAASNVANSTSSGVVPVAPSGLAATPAAVSAAVPSINLTWTDNSANEASFEVQRATNTTFTAGVVTTPVAANTTSLQATGLAVNTTYYFRVRAIGVGNAASAYTATASAVSPGQLGAPVTGITAVASAPGSTINNVVVRWVIGTQPVAVTNFTVQRSLDPAFATIDRSFTTANGAAVTYTDSTVVPSTTYYYRVITNNVYGASSPSAIASTTSNAGMPPAPTGLVATPVAASTAAPSMNLAWTNNPGSATGLVLQRARNAQFTTGLVTVNLAANATSYTDTGLGMNVLYYYRVQLVTPFGNTAWSNIVSATSAGQLNPAPTVTVGTTTTRTIPVTWTAVTTPVAAPANGWVVTLKNGAGTVVSTVTLNTATPRSYTFTGLTSATTYRAEVQARNIYGVGAVGFVSATTR